MEFAPGIHRVKAPLGNRFVCMYLLVGDEDTLLIDTGIDNMPNDILLPYMEANNIDPASIKYVLNSHADLDHTGGNQAIREIAPNATLMCHELDRAMVDDREVLITDRYRCYAADYGIDESEDGLKFVYDNVRHSPVDFSVRGGEMIRLSRDWLVEILHTPGHSRGHISVYDQLSQTMLIMDAALYNAVLTADGEPAFPPTYRYVNSYESSIQRFGGYDLAFLATSHYPLYSGTAEIAEYLGESTAFAQRIETELRRCIKAANTPITMKDIIQELSPKVGKWPQSSSEFLVWPLAGHVERLELFGLIDVQRQGDVVAFTWKD